MVWFTSALYCTYESEKCGAPHDAIKQFLNGYELVREVWGHPA